MAQQPLGVLLRAGEVAKQWGPGALRGARPPRTICRGWTLPPCLGSQMLRGGSESSPDPACSCHWEKSRGRGAHPGPHKELMVEPQWDILARGLISRYRWPFHTSSPRNTPSHHVVLEEMRKLYPSEEIRCCAVKAGRSKFMPFPHFLRERSYHLSGKNPWFLSSKPKEVPLLMLMRGLTGENSSCS